MTARGFFTAGITAFAAAVCGGAGNPLSFPGYDQTVTVNYASPEEAAKAEMKICPLPDGAERSFGTRWDDTSHTHLAKAEMLESIGVKGDFYIVAKSRGPLTPESFRFAGIRKLSENGHSIGNHSLTHPFLVDMSSEAVFREFLLTRILLERDTDRSVVSYASPYGWYGGRWLDVSIMRLTAMMLVECGMWVSGDNYIASARIPEDLWYPSHRFSANDRRPDYKMFLAGLGRMTRTADKSPLSPRITLGTHSWCDDKGNALQREWLKKHCVRPDWVQQNDHEYGAYRYSALNGKAERVSVSGNTAVFSVRRFSPAALGDAVPLSVALSGSPLSAECCGKALSRGGKGTWRLPHSPSKGVVVKVDVAGEDGRCGKIPGAELKLSADTASRKVSLRFANASSSAMTDLYAVVHLPPMFKDRRRTFLIPSVPAGGSVERTIDCGEPAPDFIQTAAAMLGASVDFTCGEGRKRVWATSEYGYEAARLFPRDVAWSTPVMPASAFSGEALAKLSASRDPLPATGSGPVWAKRPVSPTDAWYVVTKRGGRLNDEDVALAKAGAAFAVAMQFAAREGTESVLLLNVNADGPGAKIYLNGKRIPARGRKVVLPARPGVNRLVMKFMANPKDRYWRPVQAAVCENGSLAAPCECVPF